MRHVSLTCKHHPELRWTCKEIAYTDAGGYNGARTLQFKGRVTLKEGKPELYSDKSGVKAKTYDENSDIFYCECECPILDLIRAEEDKDIV